MYTAPLVPHHADDACHPYEGQFAVREYREDRARRIQLIEIIVTGQSLVC
jgi:hypothetical protein